MNELYTWVEFGILLCMMGLAALAGYLIGAWGWL